MRAGFITCLTIALFAHYLLVPLWWSFMIVIPLIILGIYGMTQSKHALRKNFFLAGMIRCIQEWFRPKNYPYFIEPDHDGRPFIETGYPLHGPAVSSDLKFNIQLINIDGFIKHQPLQNLRL